MYGTHQNMEVKQSFGKIIRVINSKLLIFNCHFYLVLSIDYFCLKRNSKKDAVIK